MTAVNTSSVTESPLYVDDDVYNMVYVPRFLYKELSIAYSATGMVLNILLISYFIRFKKYRIPTFTLLTSLAVTDMICCFASTGYGGLLYPYMTFPNAGYLCRVFIFLTCFGMISSGYHLVFFAALRFYQLVFPLRARSTITCDLHSRDVSWSVISTIIPCVAILVLHIAKYIGVALESNESLHFDQDRTRNADARAVIIVIILFYIAWFVPNSYLIIQAQMVKNYDHFRDKLYLVFAQVSFSNSTMNPLVYCFAAKSVRNDVFGMICRKGKKNADVTNSK